jgi:flagellar protein FlbT
MTGLVLKLGPKERVLVNGVVLENGDRRTRVSILTPDANILRLRDAIHPEEANTPVRRVCYIMQLILSGDTQYEQAKHQVMQGLAPLQSAFQDTTSHDILDGTRSLFEDQKIYPALKLLRQLLPREDMMLQRAAG